MRNQLSLLGRLKRLVRWSRRGNEIRAFKTNIWQTPEISEAFVNGSDANSVALADVMDREVNTYFLTRCGPSDKVLDIGCGHGIVAEYLASHGIHVTAMDVSDTLLERFRTRVEGMNLPLTIAKGDAYDIPAADAVFDTVVARMFLPHFRDWPNVLKEIARVTKPGGTILVHFPSKENAEAARRLGRKESRFSTDPDTHDPWTFYAEVSARDLAAASEKLGLKVTERVPVSFFAHNRIIGLQIGQAAYDRYQSELPGRLADEHVRDFVVWFDSAVTANAGPEFSHFAVIAFEKARDPIRAAPIALPL